MFDPETFFKGPLEAHGVVKNRGGKVIRYFYATIDAHWKDGIGTLDETFVFNDGERQKRIWTLRPDGKGKYVGTANDTVGKANIEVAGNAMFLKYVLQVPYKGRTIDVTVDDKMYLIKPDHLINESKLYKFGFKVGAITLSIRQVSKSKQLDLISMDDESLERFFKNKPNNIRRENSPLH